MLEAHAVLAMPGVDDDARAHCRNSGSSPLRQAAIRLARLRIFPSRRASSCPVCGVCKSGDGKAATTTAAVSGRPASSSGAQQRCVGLQADMSGPAVTSSCPGWRLLWLLHLELNLPDRGFYHHTPRRAAAAGCVAKETHLAAAGAFFLPAVALRRRSAAGLLLRRAGMSAATLLAQLLHHTQPAPRKLLSCSWVTKDVFFVLADCVDFAAFGVGGRLYR